MAMFDSARQNAFSMGDDDPATGANRGLDQLPQNLKKRNVFKRKPKLRGGKSKTRKLAEKL